MSQGPLGLAWANLQQRLLDDGRYGAHELDLETWRLMFMWGARAALSARRDSIDRAMMLAEVLSFEMSLKGYRTPPVIAVIEGGNDDKADSQSKAQPPLPQ